MAIPELRVHFEITIAIYVKKDKNKSLVVYLVLLVTQITHAHVVLLFACGRTEG